MIMIAMEKKIGRNLVVLAAVEAIQIVRLMIQILV
jgi:hypothetical protein